MSGWSVRPHNGQEEVRAIYDWVRRNIRYVSDPYGLDVYYPPEHAVETRAGDCDEQATILGILAEALGYPVKLRAVSRDGREFIHVYALVDVGKGRGTWLAADTVAGAGVGYEPRDAKRLEVRV